MKRLHLILALMLGGCVGPRPAPPPGAAVTTPGAWRTPGTTVAAIDVRWWERFGDPTLNALVDHALTENVDLLSAGARIAEARAQFRLTASQARPSIGLSAGGGPERDVNAFGLGLDQTQLAGQISVAYELDLFGRLSAATDAGRQAWLATTFAREATRTSLVSTVVSGYIELRALDDQLAIASDTLKSRAAELSILRRRSVSGYSSQLDLRQAEIAYEAAARLVPATRLSISKQENALSVLVGRAPFALTRGLQLGQLGIPETPRTLPADVLRQRPDIAEAEALVAAADRRLDSARAAFMPRIQLSAAAGGVASTALANPISLFSVGGSILAPLFEGGALRAGADAAAARRDQAAYAYREAALTAFHEVEDGLAEVVRIGEEEDAAKRQMVAANGALELSRNRYRAGYSSYLDQLDAERSLLAVRLQLVSLRSSRLESVVAVYRAMGGGWQRRSSATAHR